MKKSAHKVALGCRVKLYFTGETKKEAVVYKFVKQLDTKDHSPQIEKDSFLGEAILGKTANPGKPIYYTDDRKGIVGVYLLDVNCST